MPKIGPNKVSIDPKAYAARVTSAKKRVAQIDPATKAKISEYYPKVTKEAIVNKALSPKKTEKMKQMPKVKITGTASTKPRVSASMSKAQPKTTVKPKVTKKPTAPTMPTKPKPAVGADKAAKKKYGPSSHNNGYTN